MTTTLGDTLIDAIVESAKGNIQRHLANIAVYQQNPSGIGEHPDIIGAIEEEIKKIAELDDVIEVCQKYF